VLATVGWDTGATLDRSGPNLGDPNPGVPGHWSRSGAGVLGGGLDR